MKIHPNERTLGKLVARAGSGAGRRVLEHLLECDDCRRRLGDVLRWSGPRAAPDMPWTPRAYGAMLDRLVEASAEAGAPLSRQQVEAPILVAELLLHPASRRSVLLRNSERFHSWPLAELLLDRSREEAFEDPAQAESMARLGLEVVGCLSPAEHGEQLIADLEGRGQSFLANALRMRSDLTAAEEAIRASEIALASGTGDPVEAARILELKSSLRRDQQRFDEAITCLEQAISKYRRVGENDRAAGAQVKQAIVWRDAGDPEQAIRLLWKAIPSIKSKEPSRLLLCARHNLAVWSTDLGQFMQARRVFRDSEPLYDRFPDPWTQRRRAWVEGRILHGLGQLEAAEERLAWAQRGFVEQEIAYDAALVSLDLAAVYAAQGRSADLERLAGDMVPIFRARDIHREALAALAYFRHAVEMDTATSALVESLLDYLRRAQHDPGLRFERPEKG
jgi:tetratricopeptide (TPR) repeat protein